MNFGNNAEVKTINENVGTGTGNSINFKQTFTGAAFATPLGFNLTLAQKVKAGILNEKYAATMTERDYTGKNSTTGADNCRIVLDLMFNPYAPLKPYQEVGEAEKANWPVRCYAQWSVTISNELVISKNGKSFVMDDKLVSGWMTVDTNKSMFENIQAAQQASPNQRALFNLNAKTARVMRVGEFELTNTLFNMSSLDAFRTDKDGKPVVTENTVKEFLIGKYVTEINGEKVERDYWEDLVKGDVRFLNQNTIISSSECQKTFKGVIGGVDIQRPLGVQLVVRLSDTDKVNNEGLRYETQTVYTRSTATPSVTTWKLGRSASMSRSEKVPASAGMTFFDKNTAEGFFDSEYPVREEWGNSFEFKPYSQTAPSVSSGAPAGTTKAAASDDLPF